MRADGASSAGPTARNRAGVRRHGWLLGGAGCLALSLVLFAAPARFEGPILMPISPGHALSLLDSLALAPLFAGLTLFSRGLWMRRWRLRDRADRSPIQGYAAVFLAGLGLGLLLASAFSSFFWWWAIGAGILQAVLIVLLYAAARD